MLSTDAFQLSHSPYHLQSNLVSPAVTPVSESMLQAIHERIKRTKASVEEAKESATKALARIDALQLKIQAFEQQTISSRKASSKHTMRKARNTKVEVCY